MSDVLDVLKPGDIVLTSKRGFAPSSLPIRFISFARQGYQKRIWTHAAFYIGNGEVVEAITKGIVKRKLKNVYPNEEFDLIGLRCKSLKDDSVTAVVEFCRKKVGFKYDKMALSYYVIINITPPIFHFLLRSDWFTDLLNSENTYYCSELIADALLEEGGYCFDRAPSKIMPVDFFNEYGFDLVTSSRKQGSESLWKTIPITILYLLGTVVWFGLSILLVVLLFQAVLSVFKPKKQNSENIII
jgi:uncharacterized protein YycO